MLISFLPFASWSCRVAFHA